VIAALVHSLTDLSWVVVAAIRGNNLIACPISSVEEHFPAKEKVSRSSRLWDTVSTD
jgi:hypothetical protein